MKHVLSFLYLMVAMTFIFHWLGVGSPIYFRADTDPPGRRSGMSVYTDAKTGCQYLSTGFGGLAPRRDGAGGQLGCLGSMPNPVK